jgi:hypothetical protein
MPYPTTLAIVAAVSLGGAAIGVHLGNSAVAEIDPAYMHDPEVPFYADLVPGAKPRADWQAVQAQEYQASAQAQPPAGCPGCTWPVDPAPRSDPAIAAIDLWQPAARRATRATPAETVKTVETVVVNERPDPAREGVVRYASYPVDSGESEDQDPEDDGPTQ